MNNRRNKVTFRVIIALFLATILLSLASCGGTVASKDSIAQNIASSESGTYSYVADYLDKWGIKNIDLNKVAYFERVYNSVYGYEGGMPDTYEHAKKTAESFLELYYDVIDLDDRDAVTNAILTCYADSVDDPYSVYRAPEKTDEYTTDMSGKFGGIGVQVLIDRELETLTVDMVFINSPADREGILVGDMIYAVDGKTISEIGVDNVVNNMRGEIGTQVNIVVKRGDTLLSFNITRDTVEEISVSHSKLEGNIGYVRISTFKDNTYAQFVESIDALEEAGVEGIIFDLRLNTGGYLHTVCDMISYLVPNGQTIVSYQYVNQPQVVIKSESDVHPTKKDADGNALVEDHTLDLPMVVLCNEYTASSAEIFTSAIRDYRDFGILDAKIIGTVTYKKGIMQGTYMYNDYSSVTLTVAYYNPPCGENYHGIGITPDIEIQNTATEDLQYNRALEEIKNLMNANKD